MNAIPAMLTAFTDRLIAPRTKPSCQCDWHRVARKRWQDHVLSYIGWYPWQCERCLTRSYFSSRC